MLPTLDAAELVLRALADDQLAQAGAEAAALDDLHLRAQLPGLCADAAQLHVGIGAFGDRPAG